VRNCVVTRLIRDHSPNNLDGQNELLERFKRIPYFILKETKRIIKESRIYQDYCLLRGRLRTRVRKKMKEREIELTQAL
jgi:hypothetical protein